ncbi:tripartite tricarboxylate transporter TctB family protein [Microvirga sp. VF16]|uniref:tripartite tricarboxylate transporter TctB family protein n=1 Tax=Microvirga sp. VF16 TaxID=2807101 RepID=UPI00193D8120|nr:tripartite tricarboxylate transporter TctB family protein [Microvirga sp. VF16]QRM34239.1 tripartite tricarboxylate transporter TctB family protein [Microvirga sp. VF16]
MTTERSLRRGEIVLGLGVLALGLFVAIQTWSMPETVASSAVGPKLFPGLVATGLIVVGLSLLREALAGHIAHEGGLELDWPAVALVAGALVLQILLLEAVGWIPAGTLLFMLVARAFGSRRHVLNAAFGLALTALTFAVFDYGLDLNLPTGSLFERVLGSGEATE